MNTQSSPILEWFEGTGAKYFVRLPQGSVFGPVIFIIYLSTAKFANDTNLIYRPRQLVRSAMRGGCTVSYFPQKDSRIDREQPASKSPRE
ncbi:hypothetical protein J6590_030445 [Homalodisca vitripennis]|nr:hypothetical protein J6590_030445 [Homalodisca vitripennis]